ncbi:MAG: hypothetical protein PGN24_03740 [Microbacterium arborescens]
MFTVALGTDARDTITCTEPLCVEFGQEHDTDGDWHETWRVDVHRDYDMSTVYSIAVQKEVTPGDKTHSGWFVELQASEFFCAAENFGRFMQHAAEAHDVALKADGFIDLYEAGDMFPKIYMSDLFRAGFVETLSGKFLWSPDRIRAQIEAGEAS